MGIQQLNCEVLVESFVLSGRTEQGRAGCSGRERGLGLEQSHIEEGRVNPAVPNFASFSLNTSVQNAVYLEGTQDHREKS